MLSHWGFGDLVFTDFSPFRLLRKPLFDLALRPFFSEPHGQQLCEPCVQSAEPQVMH